MIYEQIYKPYRKGHKQLAFLIDPDKFPLHQMASLKPLLDEAKPDLILVGGSLVSVDTGDFICALKKHIDLPVILYPGSSLQVCKEVDAIIFLSLLSGRNPEFLISHHVTAAPLIKAHGIEAIPTGYLLVDGGKPTSVQYISQTQPIPKDKNDIAVATALAGQYLGMKLIYMDAGSGAVSPIQPAMIAQVHEALDIPLMVGGGITTTDGVEKAFEAGADLVVVGNVLEKDLSLLRDFCAVRQCFNK
ncbi:MULTISPECIES: geranylgeranylglyceryl/heptaprenylglyceryl phosphate synthase [unclassified Carboxylicivirga]|uniref:geranylgeranylglyceryl/heptaprenylglyceryl phosphate synthase n=1 Tax=Carboxylicivirga TaxID=1628153 RepID=UPI003D3465FA